MIRALMISLQSLSDARVLAILFKSIALTVLVFALLGTGLYFGLDRLFTSLGWGDDMLSALATFLILAFSGLLLFRIIAVAILWIFSDAIVDAVEDKHYPDHAARRTQPSLGNSVAMAARSVLRALGYNLLALPLYALLLITGLGLALAFLLVNALLLGRDLEDMLVARHGAAHGQLGRPKRLLLGLAGTAAMLIPFVNLLVPVVVTAMAVHMAHGSKEGLTG
jgi:CysZ protein